MGGARRRLRARRGAPAALPRCTDPVPVPVPYYAGFVMTPAWVWALLGALGAFVLIAAGALSG